MNNVPSIKSLKSHVSYRVKKLLAQTTLHLGANKNVKPNLGLVSEEGWTGLISRQEWVNASSSEQEKGEAWEGDSTAKANKCASDFVKLELHDISTFTYIKGHLA
jgi:hypothetical protein